MTRPKAHTSRATHGKKTLRKPASPPVEGGAAPHKRRYRPGVKLVRRARKLHKEKCCEPMLTQQGIRALVHLTTDEDGQPMRVTKAFLDQLREGLEFTMCNEIATRLIKYHIQRRTAAQTKMVTAEEMDFVMREVLRDASLEAEKLYNQLSSDISHRPYDKTKADVKLAQKIKEYRRTHRKAMVLA